MASSWILHESRPRYLRRNGGPARNSTISMAEVVGIAVGGSVALFIVLSTIAIFSCRWRHRRRGKRAFEANEHENADVGARHATESAQPPEIALSRRLSFNSFQPLDDADVVWGDDAGIQIHQPTKKTAKLERNLSRSLSQKAFFRVSSVRESWPLASDNLIPLALLPTQSTMVLSPVAPPGYIIEEKGPDGSTSRLSRRKSGISVDTTRSKSPVIISGRGSLDSSKSHSPTKSLQTSPKRSPAKETVDVPMLQSYKLQREATSNTQLSTILRSTSQRLRATHRISLIRTVTTTGNFPGIPPPNRLPTPPRNMTAAIHEELIDREFSENFRRTQVTQSIEEIDENEYTESLRSSIFDCYLRRTPSPGRKAQLTFESVASEHQSKSPTPSDESQNSLCAENVSDVVFLSPLSSPSKSLRGEKRQEIDRSSDGSAVERQTFIHEDSRASVSVFSAVIPNSRHNDLNDPPQQIPLTDDPFYSSFKTSKPGIPSTKIQGPRPVSFRKATFVHEATSTRPSSSPLGESIGNIQTQTKNLDPSPESLPVRGLSETNPFQWNPQEAIRSAFFQSGPRPKSPRRRGYKRSTVMRISTASVHSPRAASITENFNVRDEASQPQQLKFKIRKFKRPISLPPESPSPLPSGTVGQRSSYRPPSALKFEPVLSIHDLAPKLLESSPTLDLEDVRSTGIYSSTLSGIIHRMDQGFAAAGSDEEVFSTRPMIQAKISPLIIQSHNSIVSRIPGPVASMLPSSGRSCPRERTAHRQVRDSHCVTKERRRKREVEEAEDIDSDTFTAQSKDHRGARGMDWEFDDSGSPAGKRMSNWDTELTPVKEVSTLSVTSLFANCPTSEEKVMNFPAIRTTGNALGIMGLTCPSLGFEVETDQFNLNDSVGNVDSVTSEDLHRGVEVAKQRLSADIDIMSHPETIRKGPLSIEFEALRPILGHPPSMSSFSSLSGPVLASQSMFEPADKWKSNLESFEGSKRWSDVMTKPATGIENGTS